LLSCISLFSQTVTISDTLYIGPESQRFVGRATVASPDMTCGTATYVRGERVYTIPNGAVVVTLPANSGCTVPAGQQNVYRVTFAPSSNRPSAWTELWYVPASPATTTVRAVRAGASISTPAGTILAGQLARGGANTYQSLAWLGAEWGPLTPTDDSIGVGNGTGIDLKVIPDCSTSGQFLKYTAATNTFSCAAALTDSFIHAPSHGVSGSDPVTIAQSQVTDLVTDMGNKADSTHQHNASAISAGTLAAERGGLGADASAFSGIVRMSGGTATASDLANADLPAAFDVSGKTSTKPAKSGTLAPATCSVGEVFFDTDATAGENWLLCTSSNTWTAVVGGGGGSLTTYSVASFTAPFTSQTTVTLTHNFGSTKQVIACYDGSNQWIEPLAITIGGPSSTVTFSAAQSGSCTVIGGTGLYEESFTSQTSVNLDHDYNTQNIMVKCYDGDENEVEPDGVVATDANNALVTFAVAQTGRCSVAATLAVGGGGGSGTVTSVGATVPSGFSVSGSPVTTSGTLAVTLDSQAQNKVLISPAATSGSPTFRVLVVADLPSVVAYNDTANAFTAGAKQTMEASATTAGLKVACVALPSSPTTGDIACDNADGNKLKYWDGSEWVDTTGTGGGGSGDATILQTTATLSSWGAITAAGTSGSCVRKNISLSGVVGGDVVTVGPPATLETGLQWGGLAGTDIAIVQLCNNTGASITPADGGTYRVQVLRSTI